MALGDSEKAAGLYQRLLPYSGKMVSHPTAVCYGPADLYLGMLSSLLNNLGKAEKFLACAASLSEKPSKTCGMPTSDTAMRKYYNDIITVVVKPFLTNLSMRFEPRHYRWA
jgi:hypothetical protein